jgi:hypothetical protein
MRAGQPAHVVVRLDGGRRAFHRHRFDHVGVDGALPEPPDVLDAVRLHVEHVDERFADGLALGFRVGEAGEGAVEPAFGVDAHHVQAQFLVRMQHFLVLILRSRPLSTKMQNRLSSMASWMSVAATLESTPPERAITTLSLPSSF